MKQTLFFIILFPACATAQTSSRLDSLIQSRLNELKESWTLGIDTSSDVVDIKVYNKFKSLFDLNASIDDDLNAYFQYDAKLPSYKIDKKLKPFDEYAHDVALQIKNLVIDSTIEVTSDTKDLNKITFTLRRSLRFEKPRRYVLPTHYTSDVISSRRIEFQDKKDSVKMLENLEAKSNQNPDVVYRFALTELLQVSMAVKNDTVLITGMRSTINDFNCTNDTDLDAVINEEDSLKTTRGDFTANGKPDFDLDGIADAFDKCKNTYGYLSNHGCPPSYFYTKRELNVILGLQQHLVTIEMPELNQLGYVDQSGVNLVDVLQSKQGKLNTPRRLISAYSGGSYSFYFGKKKKQVGISLGITFSRFSGDYTLLDSIVYTYKAFDSMNYYRRQIKSKNLNESVASNIYNFPVLFNFRLHADRKNVTVINIRTGPSIMLFTNVSNYNAKVDFGGIYQVEGGQIVYRDILNSSLTSNLYLTSDIIKSRSGGNDPNIVFSQMAKSYDFKSNESYVNKQSFTRIALAYNLDFSVQHKVSETFIMKAGAHILYAPSFKANKNYKPVDKTTDTYQSIFNSNAKANYHAMGLNIGFVYNF